MKRWYLYLGLAGIVFLSVTGVEGLGMRDGQSVQNGDPNDLLAFHDRKDQPGIVTDQTSPGICPQPRNTPRAPNEYLVMKNPLPLTEANFFAGEALFKIDAKPTACRVCHGFKGNGLGIIHHRLSPKPRNFTCYYTMRDIPDGQIFWIIKNGSPGTAMPSFGYLSDEEVWQLTLYLRHFAE